MFVGTLSWFIIGVNNIKLAFDAQYKIVIFIFYLLLTLFT